MHIRTFMEEWILLPRPSGPRYPLWDSQVEGSFLLFAWWPPLLFLVKIFILTRR
jgi:hypothetical protein